MCCEYLVKSIVWCNHRDAVLRGPTRVKGCSLWLKGGNHGRKLLG